MAKKILLASLMFLLGSTGAWGSLVTSVSDLPAGSYDFIDFESQPLSTYASGNSLSITSGTNTVTFTGMDGQFRIVNAYSDKYNTTGHYLDNGPYTGNGTNADDTWFLKGPGFITVKISFRSPVEAFGFNMGAIDNLWNLTAFDTSGNVIDTQDFPLHPQDWQNLGPSYNTNEFYGLRYSSRNISYVYLTNTEQSLNLPSNGSYGAEQGVDFVLIDNFRSSDPPPVPIPGTVWLITSGLVALALRRLGRIKRFF